MKVSTNVKPKPKKNGWLPTQKNYGKGGFAPKGQTEEDRDAIYSNDVKKIKKLAKTKMLKRNKN